MSQVEQVVLGSSEPMKVARQLVAAWATEGGAPGLYTKGTTLYEWYGGTRWVGRDEDWLFNRVIEVLEDATVKTETASGHIIERYKLNVRKAEDVCRLIKAVTEYPYDRMPKWIDGSGRDADHCIAFEDVVVDVVASAKAGQLVHERKTASLVTNMCLRVPLVEGPAPVWERCMSEWGGNDPKWTELRERAYGYSLMGTRKWKKWLFEWGESFGGKSSGTRDVLRKLVGNPGYFGVQVRALVEKFGLAGVEEAHILTVSEVESLDDATGKVLEALVKQAVGLEEVTINEKYGKIKKHQVLRCFPIIQSNDALVLPNTKRGLSTKMLPLYFGKSFDGRIDAGLEGKLEQELPWIARRLVEAAVRLEVDGKWEFPESSYRAKREFELENNAFDAFLEACFVKMDAWVHADEVRRQRGLWEKEVGKRLVTGKGERVSDQNLVDMLVKRSTWGLVKERRGMDQSRGVRGIALRRVPDFG